uniref:DNA adenine methylase n=1 Tax=Clostridium sp. NkU-1 TaxID=1095009 RepID=UPI0006D2901B
MANFEITDYTELYGSIMKFGKNKNKYIHQWYPFVEGYSKEFIRNIVAEYTNIHGEMPKVCLEPFSGSGTTALELQKLGIKCYAFEVSPFMYNLSKAKLETKYTIKSFNKYKKLLERYILQSNNIYREPLFPEFKTIVEKK